MTMVRNNIPGVMRVPGGTRGPRGRREAPPKYISTVENSTLTFWLEFFLLSTILLLYESGGLKPLELK